MSEIIEETTNDIEYDEHLGERYKHQTNADKIRHMPDEQLARYLVAEQINFVYAFLKGLDDEDLFNMFLEEVNKNMAEVVKEKLDWLKAEVKK